MVQPGMDIISVSSETDLKKEVLKWFNRHPNRTIRNTSRTPMMAPNGRGGMQFTMVLMWEGGKR